MAKKEVIVLGKNYITGKRLSVIGFLADWLYKHLVTKTVVVCVDILVLKVVWKDGKPTIHALLGKRTRNPAPHYFIIGGRLWRGETFEEAAMRNLKRELGLKIKNRRRFQNLVTNNYLWDTSAQSKNEGSHTVGITMVIMITDEEAATIVPNDEYADLKWLPLTKIAMDERYHPAIRDIAMAAMFHKEH